MIITWYGTTCFKLQSGDLVIVIDPTATHPGFTPPRFHSNIALLTQLPEQKGETGSFAGEPFVISGPGEYEMNGISIIGIESLSAPDDGKQHPNTMYRIEWEGIHLLHMGHFGETTLRSQIADELGTIDILMVPIGGDDVLKPEPAAKITSQIEPSIVLPMHYDTKDQKKPTSPFNLFLKSTGSAGESMERLVVRKKDIGIGETARIVELKQT